MSVYESMHELIGHTPMVRLSHFDFPESVKVYAKLELWNPAGSVKDRTGLYLVRDAERRGLLKPGGTILEATAGNTGLGIAFAALNGGYRVIFVVPEGFSIEKQTLMRALGAEIINTPAAEGIPGARKRMEALQQEIPCAVALGQFTNPANPLAHYETTGPEIWEDLRGRIDYFAAGAGSGGTFSGIARYLKEQDPGVTCVLADPLGSIIGGGEPGCFDIEGIGNHFIADTMDTALVDRVIKITDEEARDGAKQLAKREGIIAGLSSGAALAAVRKLVDSGAKGTIVTVLPDRGDRYFSKNLFA